jgi:hypothetical protein
VRDLARLTVDDFEQVVGEVFTIDAGDAGRIELELTEATLHDQAASAVDDTGKRSPFSVEFRGPVEPILAQQTTRLENASLGPLEIFIVPTGRDEAGTRYEAVFN